ncbi:MAG: hypothetical protein KDA21_10795, partial [Phycisphaerales bacterium]|nr:hypothetical protein [Phycisphaerales bacterium]
MDIRTLLGPIRCLVLLLFALGVSAAPGLCQDLEGTSPEEEEGRLQTQAPSDEVLITVEQYGVGGVIRPGGYAGIRIGLRDKQTDPRDVAVRLHIPDPDGDTVLEEKQVSIGGDIAGGALWLYGVIPPTFSAGDYLTVTVHELNDGTVGRQIASLRPTASTLVDLVSDRRGSDVGMIGVIVDNDGLGQRASVPGLSHYENPMQFVAQRDLVVQHQPFKVVSSIDVGLLPDRWMGLEPYEVLVWSGIDPSSLDGARAGALREWIQRGGHLVVMLRHPGQAWFGRDVERVADFVPRATIRPVGDADLEDYRSLLTWRTREEAELPARRALYAFDVEPDAQAGEAIPVVSGPDGPVVVRRLMGAGMITFVGLNLADVRGPIRGDVFWHRLLGQRFSVVVPRYTGDGKPRAYTQSGSIDETIADRGIGAEISRSRTAGVGILLALVLF